MTAPARLRAIAARLDWVTLWHCVGRGAYAPPGARERVPLKSDGMYVSYQETLIDRERRGVFELSRVRLT